MKGEKWQPGNISDSLGKTNYKVTDTHGKTIHRHIDHFRRRARSSLVYPLNETQDQPDPQPYSGVPETPLQSESTGPVRSGQSTPVVERGIESEDCFVTPEKSFSPRQGSSNKTKQSLAAS